MLQNIIPFSVSFFSVLTVRAKGQRAKEWPSDKIRGKKIEKGIF